VASVIAVISVALAVSGLGAAVRTSAHAAQVQALASASVSSAGGRGLLPALPPHPARAASATVPKVSPPVPAVAAAPAAAPSAPSGPIPVAQVALPLVDTSRKAGSGPRVLTTSVWYPAAAGSPDNVAAPAASGGPFPLIVFAHGYNVTPAAYAGLLRSWARAGYVVAAPTFPLTNPGAPGGPDEGDVVNQPADVRFVIDQLLWADAKPGLLGGLIDPHKIAVAGHSDGAITAAEVAYNTCCRDTRISAAIVMAGAAIGVPGGSYFPPASAPMLAVQGGADHSNNPQNSLGLYTGDGGGPKYLLDLPGASHEGPFMDGGRAADVVHQATIDFLGRYLKGGSTSQLLHDGSVPGVASIAAPLGQS
jgi:dienelactone hydrolase